jgi:hypothetical protein
MKPYDTVFTPESIHSLLLHSLLPHLLLPTRVHVLQKCAVLLPQYDDEYEYFVGIVFKRKTY